MEEKKKREQEEKLRQQSGGSDDGNGGEDETDDETDDEDDYGPSPAAGIWAGSKKLKAETEKIEDEADGCNKKEDEADGGNKKEDSANGQDDDQQPAAKKSRHEWVNCIDLETGWGHTAVPPAVLSGIANRERLLENLMVRNYVNVTDEYLSNHL